MDDLAVRERRDTRVVLEREPLEAIVSGLLEVAVAELGSPADIEHGFQVMDLARDRPSLRHLSLHRRGLEAITGDERLVDDRHPLGQVRVMRQVPLLYPTEQTAGISSIPALAAAALTRSALRK